MPATKTAVVGTGHLGSLHARIYSELPEAELVGVYDIDREKCRERAGRFGVRAFESLEEAAGAAEAISLAVPTDLHYEIALKLIDAGVHLLIEKPVTEREEHARELAEKAESAGLVLAVGHVERFNPALVAASEHIGEPLFVESERLAPFNPRGTEVPVVLDLMIHDIDIVLSIIRRPVVSVQAMGIPVFTESVDIANARLVFEGGAVASVASSRVSLKKSRKMRFFSSERYISVDMLRQKASAYRKRPGAQIDLERGRLPGSVPEMMSLVERLRVRIDRGREPLKLELGDFLGCVRSGGTPVVGGRDGLLALQVAGRIMEAIKDSLEAAGFKS